MPVEVVVLVSPALGKEARMEELLIWLAAEIKKNEPGLIRLQWYRQVGGEGEGATDFVCTEQYADEAAYAAHSKTAHYNEAYKTAMEEELFAKPLRFMKLEPLPGAFVRS